MTNLKDAINELATLIKRGVRIDQVYDTEVNDEGNPVSTFGQQITLLDGPLKGQSLVMWRYQSFLAYDDEEAAKVAGELFGIDAAALMQIERSGHSAEHADRIRWVAAIQGIWRGVLGGYDVKPLIIHPRVAAHAEGV